MKCQCGKTDFTPTMTLEPEHRLPEEIGYFHNGVRCGWAYECRDCWPKEGFGTGYGSELEAMEGLKAHWRYGCGPNVDAMIQTSIENIEITVEKGQQAMRTPESQTRVVPTGASNGYGPGRWLAQYHDADTDLWFDIGDPHENRVDAVFATMPWPDGDTPFAYQAVHEFVRDALGEEYPAERAMDRVIEALGELIETATTFRANFEKALSRSALARELLDLEREVHESVDAGLESSTKKHQIGTEYHTKLRRAKRSAEALDGPEKDECLAIIDRTSRYVLRTIFHFDPDEISAGLRRDTGG